MEGREGVPATALVTLTTSTPRGGLEEESLDEPAGAVDTTTEVVLSRLWEVWAGAGAAGQQVCLEEEASVTGRVLSGPVLPKTGLQAAARLPGGDSAAEDTLKGKAFAGSLRGGGPETNFDVGSAEDAAGGADAERWRAGLTFPNKHLCAGLMTGGCGDLADLSP